MKLAMERATIQCSKQFICLEQAEVFICPVIHLVGFALHDRAFIFVTSLTRISSVCSTDLSLKKAQLAVQ